MIVYRILKYEGNEEWIHSILDKSLHGIKYFSSENKITAATISDDDHSSIEFIRNALHDMQARVHSSGNKSC